MQTMDANKPLVCGPDTPPRAGTHPDPVVSPQTSIPLSCRNSLASGDGGWGCLRGNCSLPSFWSEVILSTAAVSSTLDSQMVTSGLMSSVQPSQPMELPMRDSSLCVCQCVYMCGSNYVLNVV